MNSRQKIVQQHFLNAEERIIKRLNSVYRQAQKAVTDKIEADYKNIDKLNRIIQTLDPDDPQRILLESQVRSKVYQVSYQESLKNQVSGILDNMQVNQYVTVSDYLRGCYDDGFIGSVYDLHGQGIPVTIPINQQKVTQAVQLDSKISEGLYTRLGVDVTDLKRKITAQVSRSMVTGDSFARCAERLAEYSNIGFNKAVKITRTEGHRIQTTAGMDALYDAKDIGSDVVKQWDATLDGDTRPSHRAVDGEIRELDEPFSNGLMYPGDPNGSAAEVINCRCALLQRARWALDEAELQTLKDRAAFFGLNKTENFDEFKSKYLKAIEAPMQTEKVVTFVPAKTKQDAVQYASGRLAESVNYNGVSLENANIINQRLTELFDKYPVNRLDAIEVGGKGVMSANWHELRISGKKLGKALEEGHTNFLLNQESTRQSISIIEKRWAGKRMPPMIQRDIEKLRNSLNFSRWGVNESYADKVAATVTHEFGHILADQYFGQINDSVANPHIALNYSLRSTRNLVKSTYDQAWQNGDIYAISEYGSKNEREFFAECFVMFENGEKLPDYIDDMMRGIITNGIL